MADNLPENKDHIDGNANNMAQNTETTSPANFSQELENQQTTQNEENYAQQQEQLRRILTPEEEALMPDRYVWRIGFGRRLGAYIIDAVFAYIFMIIAALITGIGNELLEAVPVDVSDPKALMANMEGMQDFILARILPLSLAVTFVYYSLEVIFAQSLGKMLLGIMIGTDDKKFAGIGTLLKRFAVKHINSILSVVFLVTGLGFIDSIASLCAFVIFVGCLFVFGARKQALHDMIAHTAVYFKDELMQLDENEK
jgi:uncharacterized RDD family membrane protein YckC